jgi:hypothetical protein
MANTIAAALLADVVRERVITVLQNRFAPLNAFSQDFSADEMAPLAKIQVKKATAGSTTLTNATNFEQGDSTLAAVEVQVAQYTQPFHMTNAEMQSGHKMADLVDINIGALADKIMSVALVPVTVANYGTASVVDTAANFDVDDLQTLWGDLAKSETKNLVLQGDYFAKFLPTNRESFVPGDGGYGFDGFYLNTAFTGAGANITGFACHPQALAVASGVPVLNAALANLLLDSQVITIPGLNLSVTWYQWASTSSRQVWSSFDVMFGAKAADTTAMKIVTSS